MATARSTRSRTVQTQRQRHTRLRRVGLCSMALLLSTVPIALGAGAARATGPAPGTWTMTGSMTVPRAGFTITLLRTGKVLVAGGDKCTDSTNPTCGPFASAELYDPATGAFTPTGSMTVPRIRDTAIVLATGQVLVAGGCSDLLCHQALSSAELYDPATGRWSPTGSMGTIRLTPVAAVLPDGDALFVGGLGPSPSSAATTAELYHPATGTWSYAQPMLAMHASPSAVQLSDGRFLVAGDNENSTTTELYDPRTNTWSLTGSMTTMRSEPTMTLLADGRVLLAGGDQDICNDDGCETVTLTSTELYNPSSGTFTLSGAMSVARHTQAAALLPNGQVLVAGGDGTIQTPTSAELYDPASGTWTVTGNMLVRRFAPSATLLPTGQVLVVGGAATSDMEASAELYTPQVHAALHPVPTSAASGSTGATTTLTGTGFGAFEKVTIKLYCSAPTCTSHTILGTATTNTTGAFSQTVTLPSTVAVGKHEIGAIGQSSGTFADHTFSVTP